MKRSLSTSGATSLSPGRPQRPPWRRFGLIALVLICMTFLALEILFAVSAASNSGCVFCHVPARAARDLSHSSHAEAACGSCHRLPGVAGVVRYNLQAADHFLIWLARQPASPRDQVALVASTCPRCHEGLAQTIVTVDGVKMSHKQVMGPVEGDTRTANIPCVRCHARVAHSPAPGGHASLDSHSLCIGCHDGLTVSKECKTCHTGTGFMRAVSGTVTVNPHPAGWAKGHGMGDQPTCSLCHAGASCQRCHKVSLPHDPETYLYTHGKEAVSAGKACLSCHDQHACDDCHRMPMPHREGYLREHGKEAVDRGTPVCVGCHAPDGCDTCHLRHIHPGVPKSVRDKMAAQSSAAEPPGRTTSTTNTTSPAS